MVHQNATKQEDPVTWFVVQGDDVKDPMIENAEQLEPRGRRRMEKLFGWTADRLTRDGFESTLRELRERGTSAEHARKLLHEVIAEWIPGGREHEEIEELIGVLPEDREAVDVMQKVG